MVTGLSCCRMEDFPGSYSKILLGSERNFLVSTFLSGGSQSCFSVEDRSLARNGGTGGGMGGEGRGRSILKRIGAVVGVALGERSVGLGLGSRM